MVIRNEFLLNLVVHNRVVGNCFCAGCRIRRLQQVITNGYTNNDLYVAFVSELVQKEEQRLNSLHQTILQQIVYGKAYKDSSLEHTNYRYFKSWAKTQPNFAHLSKEELSKFCDKVNEANVVFDSWDVIVNNLTDNRMDQVDARRLSVRQLCLAKNINWCLSYNEILRKKGRNEEEVPYPEEKYRDIFQHIVNSGILDDIENNPQMAAIIGGRLQSDMVRRCSVRYRPY